MYAKFRQPTVALAFFGYDCPRSFEGANFMLYFFSRVSSR
jgi:hypothetical protein